MLRRILPLFVVLLVPATIGHSQDASQQVVWDFTRPETIEEQIRWIRNDGVLASESGLRWDDETDREPEESWSRRAVRIQSRSPIAVGWAWRPATEVWIEAKAEPAGAFRDIHREWLFYAGDGGILYARYSADGHHWSTWQPLELQRPRDRDDSRLIFRIPLRVPAVAQDSYRALLREAPREPVSRTHVAQNQEAAVEWIVEQQPDFFAKELPFIGYLEFLWEVHLRGHQQIEQLKIDIRYPRPTRVNAPPGHDWTTPWRFRAAQEGSEVERP